MKRTITSLTLIIMAGAVGLVLSNGHAMLMPDVEWTAIDDLVSQDARTQAYTANRPAQDDLAGFADRPVVSSARPTDASVPEHQATVEARSSVGALETSPRPRARSEALAFKVAHDHGQFFDAQAQQMSIDADVMWSVTDEVQPAQSFGAIDPSSVSLATVMSKGPMVGSPVPNYMHGVFR